MATAAQLQRADFQDTATLRVLRALGWGTDLLNLGYFVWRGPFNLVNLLPSRFRFASAQHRLLRKAAKLLQPGSGDRILDVTSGRGRSSFYLANAYPGTEVIGAELLPGNLQIARALFGEARGLSFINADIAALPFQDGFFDRLFCLEASRHFSDRVGFLKEAARVVKPGGRVLVVDFMWKERQEVLLKNDPRLDIVHQTWGLADFSTLGEYVSAAVSAGFKVQQQIDWTKSVTGPLQAQFDALVWVMQTKFGRWATSLTHACLRGFSRRDWLDLAQAAAAHRFVHRHSRYLCLVLEKVS